MPGPMDVVLSRQAGEPVDASNNAIPNPLSLMDLINDPAYVQANRGMPVAGWNALDYMRPDWNPDAAASASPGFFRDRNGATFSDDWRLLGRGPGWIVRGGQVLNAMTPQAKQGLPWNADPSYSDTAESGVANYPRTVGAGAALTGRNKFDAYYWPGGTPWGHTRWPYGTDV